MRTRAAVGDWLHRAVSATLVNIVRMIGARLLTFRKEVVNMAREKPGVNHMLSYQDWICLYG